MVVSLILWLCWVFNKNHTIEPLLRRMVCDYFVLWLVYRWLYHMKLYLILIFLYLPTTVRSQTNQLLKRELDSMFVLDQKYRGYTSDIAENPTLADSLMTALNVKTDLTNTLWAYQNRIDSSNLVRVERVISTYGYPGITLVGKPTNEAAWYVIQHSPKIKHYFPLIQRAGQADELPFYLVAMMQDRLMTEQRKPQLYGTGHGLRCCPRICSRGYRSHDEVFDRPKAQTTCIYQTKTRTD